MRRSNTTLQDAEDSEAARGSTSLLPGHREPSVHDCWLRALINQTTASLWEIKIVEMPLTKGAEGICVDGLWPWKLPLPSGPSLLWAPGRVGAAGKSRGAGPLPLPPHTAGAPASGTCGSLQSTCLEP